MMDRERLLELQHQWHADDLAAQKEIAVIAKTTADTQAASVGTQLTGLRLAALALIASSAIGVAGIVQNVLIRDTRPNVTNNYPAPSVAPFPGATP